MMNDGPGRGREVIKMAETLGSLIDKLTIANIRLWHLEDTRRDRNLPDRERLAAADKISIVNGERNDLIDEIDEFLYKAAHGKVKLKAPKVKIQAEEQAVVKSEGTLEIDSEKSLTVNSQEEIRERAPMIYLN